MQTSLMNIPETSQDRIAVQPMDEHNITLVNNVHPSNWVNPQPEGKYNIVVIGAGTAGLVTAVIAAGVGAKVALIERHLMGGDCLNVGCVPSKGVIRAATAWADVKRAEEFGLHIPPGIKYDFGAAMARMRKLRARISRTDSAHRYKSLGVDVYIGDAQFLGEDRISVVGRAGNRTLEFVKAAICTGARASDPPVPGLREAGYLTNETVFTLTELPPRLGVIGAGPIGLGAALITRSLGAEVTILDVLDYRLARARELGIPSTIRAQEGGLREHALALTDGLGFDKVVECVGGRQERTVADAVSMVKRGGQITVVGTFPENRATIPIAYLKDREIDMNFSRGNFQAFAPCLDLVATGQIDPNRYISHRFPLSRAEDALRLLEARDVEAHKIVLHPQQSA